MDEKALALVGLVTRHVLHAFASPLAALQMQMEMGDSGAARQAADEMVALLDWLRAAVGGKTLAPTEFARLTAARVAHRPAEVAFAPDAAPRAMQTAALLLPAVAGRLGGRGPVVARADAGRFVVEIHAPVRPADPALKAALAGAVPTDSALAPVALAAVLAGPLRLEGDAACARIAG